MLTLRHPLLVSALAMILAQQTRAPLSDTDLVLADLRPGSPANVVRLTLGSSDSARIGNAAVGDCYEHRYFKGVTINLLRDTVYNFELTDSLRLTARGLRVGDRLDRVRSLYGVPLQTTPYWEYAKQGDEHVRLIVVPGPNGRVRAINLGYFANCD